MRARMLFQIALAGVLVCLTQPGIAGKVLRHRRLLEDAADPELEGLPSYASDAYCDEHPETCMQSKYAGRRVHGHWCHHDGNDDMKCFGLGCFPGNAVVRLADGRLQPLRDLVLGDKVAVQTADGNLGFDDVFAFGHVDPLTFSAFVRIRSIPASSSDNSLAANASRILRLTPDHFLPTAQGAQAHGESRARLFKRARDVEIGDTLFVAEADSSSFAGHIVTEVTSSREVGLFNPLTLGGTIVVDGVVASVHSEWFLDGVVDTLGLTSYLPLAYQAVLAPFHLLYKAMGKEAYIALYHALDSASGGLAEFGTLHGGTIFAASSITSLALATAFVYAMHRQSLVKAARKA